MAQKIGFIGLGKMGFPIASNLSKSLQASSNPPLRVWTRNSHALTEFVNANPHSIRCASIEELAKTSDVVITSLANDKVGEEVYSILFSATRSIQSRLIFVDTSTLFPTLVARLGKEATAVPNRFFCSCPVFGPPTLAEKAALLVAVSGELEARKTVEKLLVPAVARKAFDLGEEVERAASFKLTGNAVVIGVVDVLGQTMTLADRSGVGAENLFEFIKEFFPVPTFLNYGNRLVSNDFKDNVGFPIWGGIKDSEHILALSSLHHTPIPVIESAHSHFLTAKAVTKDEADRYDWSSMVAAHRLAAGAEPLERPYRPLASSSSIQLQNASMDQSSGSQVDGSS
ncbi:NAD(P)-binding protein [Atractiella rhizophila]|nr:NAD(P)-binding protein [Atractiella rhizophila]